MLTQLEDAGLSKNEAKVYLAMLELGPATVLDISAKARVNRPTAYVEIEALTKKGLAKTQKKNGKVHFAAESPERLEFLLDKKGAEIEVRRKELRGILPELTAAFSLTGEKPVVRYYEGKEGLEKLQQEVLRCKEKLIRSISRPDRALTTDLNRLKKNQSERVRRKIHSKYIYTSQEGPIIKTDRSILREAKFVPLKKLPITFDFTVFDDKVKFEILRGTSGGIIIQNRDIAQSFKNLFDFVWNSIED